MMLNIILFILIYFSNYEEAKEIHIPLCAAWNSTGTILVGRINGTSGNDTTTLNQPSAIVIRENDTMYVVDSGNNRLMKYKNGSYFGEQVNVGTGTNGGFLSNPQDIVFNGADEILISEAGKNRIVRWVFDPPDIEIVANLPFPTGMYLSEDAKDLYVVENSNYPRVLRYDLNSLKRVKVAGDGDRESTSQILENLYGPIGIYVDEKQNVYVAESSSHRITKWPPESEAGQRVAGAAVGGAELSNLYGPTSVIVDEKDNLFITDRYNNRILRRLKGNAIAECLIGCSAPLRNASTIQLTPLTQPYDAAFDSQLNLIVVEKSMNRVQKFKFYFELSCMLQHCRPPIISIKKSNPLIYIRNQSVTFLITAEIDCHIWVDTEIKCKATACFPGDMSCTATDKLNTIVNSFLIRNSYDSYDMIIPPFGLPVGNYSFSCMMIMKLTGLNSTINTTLQIIRSSVIITLLPLGKSKITLGYQQQYTFHSNVLSDDNQYQNMKFVYYCRKYPGFNYSMLNGNRLNIDDDSQDPKNSSCFNLKLLPQSFVYDDGNDTIRSSLTIMNKSLELNQTYEFYVEMYDDKDLIDKSDPVLVEIQSKNSIFVSISIIFDTLTLDDDYQLLNPSTQIILESSSSSSIDTLIQWKIYQGLMNKNSKIEWKECNVTENYLNHWFYGLNTSLFTATREFFLAHKNVPYWQFEVIYTDKDSHGSGSVQLKTNHPPMGKYCITNPSSSYTSTLYKITCQGWTDLDGIKDYFLHIISSKNDTQMSIAHSLEPVFDVYLPSGNPKSNYTLRLVVHVRDMLGAWTESNIMTITVQPDEDIVNAIVNFPNDVMENLLSNGDQNQLINSFSTIINHMSLHDQEILMNNSQVRIAELIVSDFETVRAETSVINESDTSSIFLKKLKHRSSIREHLLKYYENYWVPITIEEIIILSSTINQLTDTTSEWTRTSLAIASNICNQLTENFYNLSREITFEQIALVVNPIAQCTSNIFTGVNAPLQERGQFFDNTLNATINLESGFEGEEYIDYILLRNKIPDCNDDRISDNQICKEILIYDDNSTIDILHKNRLLYHQQILATDLRGEIEESISLLGKSVRRHLNIHQGFGIFYPALRMLVEQVPENDINDKSIDLSTRNASVYLPNNLDYRRSSKLGIQTSLLPLAPAGGIPNVRLSTALTLSVLGDNDYEVEINATNNELIEMFIPRDINLPIPIFLKQNITFVVPPKRGTFKVNRQFFIYYVNLTQTNPNITVSVHFELKPENRKLSYAIIYKFEIMPAYNSTHKSIDGSTIFCYQNLVDESDYYKLTMDNLEIARNKSVLIGIRELDDKECSMTSLPPITDQPYLFSSNYSVRSYTSGCYYLDGKGRWRSDGMKVGPKTNFEYTHCYSNHT